MNKVENIVANGEIALYSHNVFKSSLLKRCQKESVCGKGLMYVKLSASVACIDLASFYNNSIQISFNLFFIIYVLWLLFSCDNYSVCFKSISNSICNFNLFMTQILMLLVLSSFVFSNKSIKPASFQDKLLENVIPGHAIQIQWNKAQVDRFQVSIHKTESPSLYEAVHGKRDNLAFLNSVGSDQPVLLQLQ